MKSVKKGLLLGLVSVSFNFGFLLGFVESMLHSQEKEQCSYYGQSLDEAQESHSKLVMPDQGRVCNYVIPKLHKKTTHYTRSASHRFRNLNLLHISLKKSPHGIWIWLAQFAARQSLTCRNFVQCRRTPFRSGSKQTNPETK